MVLHLVHDDHHDRQNHRGRRPRRDQGHQGRGEAGDQGPDDRDERAEEDQRGQREGQGHVHHEHRREIHDRREGRDDHGPADVAAQHVHAGPPGLVGPLGQPLRQPPHQEGPHAGAVQEEEEQHHHHQEGSGQQLGHHRDALHRAGAGVAGAQVLPGLEQVLVQVRLIQGHPPAGEDLGEPVGSLLRLGGEVRPFVDHRHHDPGDDAGQHQQDRQQRGDRRAHPGEAGAGAQGPDDGVHRGGDDQGDQQRQGHQLQRRRQPHPQADDARDQQGLQAPDRGPPVGVAPQAPHGGGRRRGGGGLGRLGRGGLHDSTP
nr:hypothetical protein [Rothia kristinae]